MFRYLLSLARSGKPLPRSLSSSSSASSAWPRPLLRGYSAGTPAPNRGQPPPSFQDGSAFRLKTLPEILRGIVVLKFCSYPTLVNNSTLLMNVTRRLLGKWIFRRVMRLTAYRQFVAGESEEEIGQCLETLSKLRIRPMLAVPLEDDVGTHTSESRYGDNLQAMFQCVDLSVCSQYRSLLQLKVTALMDAELCRKLTLLLTQSPAAWDLAVHRLMEVMDGQDLAFPSLTESEAQQLRASLNRLNAIGQYASQRRVRILVDAEYTYLNPAISLVTKAMMGRFNQSEPTVWNTYQCYLKDSYNLLLTDVNWASSLGLCFGVKLVRGAYMVKERELARSMGYPDPIQPNWEATNKSYQKLLDYVLGLVAERRDRFSLVIATHNENSIHHAVRRMKDLGITQDNESLCFAQLLGMCDHISLTLGSAGYTVYKSIPYGSVEEVMPYLVRRAQENLSVLKGLRRERDLLWGELWRRLTKRGKQPD